MSTVSCTVSSTVSSTVFSTVFSTVLSISTTDAEVLVGVDSEGVSSVLTQY